MTLLYDLAEEMADEPRYFALEYAFGFMCPACGVHDEEWSKVVETTFQVVEVTADMRVDAFVSECRICDATWGYHPSKSLHS